jgi:hypothetical protein
MKADLVLHNGKIFTASSKQKWATALAVWKNRFIFVGNDEESKAYIGEKTKCIDAMGRTILPGFIDSHCHMASIASEHTLQVDCTPMCCDSISHIIHNIEIKAKTTPPGEWIIGFGYDETKLKENRHILCRELDRATKQHPVLIKSFTYHFGIVNSAALKLAKIDNQSKNPPGGVFQKDQAGNLTGLCLEEAFFMWISGFSKNQPIIPNYSETDKAKALYLISKDFNKLGITSIGDASSDFHTIKACENADQAGELTVRINMMMHERCFKTLKAAGLKTGFGNERYKIGSIKSFADGACAGRTAWLSTPYGEDLDYRGIQVKKTDEMKILIKKYHDAGFQISVHANGDAAISMVLDAYEKALEENPKINHRHRIEHCTFVNEEILSRMKKLGVCAAPFANYILTQADKLDVYGDWINMMFAHRSFIDHKIPIGGSTDFPVVSPNPLLSIQSLVTRENPSGEILGGKQKISLEEAINIYTLGSAYLSFEENLKGSIEPGKLADFIILDKDIFTVAPSGISKISVVQTFWDGKTVYQK